MEDRMQIRMRENSQFATIQHQQIENEIKKDIEIVTTRVDTIERWRWVMMGGAAAAGFLVSHLEIFNKFFK
jgi:hypothetical protein